MAKTKYYETLLLVRVLSDRQLETFNLGDIASQCDSGDCVGEVVMDDEREVSAAAMGELLIAAGSEHGFMGLQDESLETLVQELDSTASQEGCSEDLVVVDKGALDALKKAAGLDENGFPTTEL